MEIRQLTYFRAVVEAGSISGAARRLNLSQPPLSYHMKMLEQELGVELFRRGRRRIELTEAGRLLYERAGGLLDQERAIALEVASAGHAQTLRVGVTPTTSPLLAPALADLNRQENRLRFELHDANTFRLREMLLQRALDCALLRSPVSTEGLQAVSLGAEPLMAVGSCPALQGEETCLAELTAVPLILYRRYDAFIRGAFYEARLMPTVRAMCDDARTALSLAREGVGVALLPRSMQPVLGGVPARTVREARLETEILMVWNSPGPPAEGVEALAEALRARGPGETLGEGKELF